MPNLLENKVAIVTGSGRGVGKGVACKWPPREPRS